MFCGVSNIEIINDSRPKKDSVSQVSITSCQLIDAFDRHNCHAIFQQYQLQAQILSRAGADHTEVPDQGGGDEGSTDPKW